MVDAWAVFLYCFTMFFGGVAFVFVPVIHREFFVYFEHIFVSVGFGEDRCGGDAEVFSVAFDDGLVWNIVEFFEAIPVYDNEFWCLM